MQQCQVNDELLRQIRNLAPAHNDILLSQVHHDLLIIPGVQEELFAHISQHTISDVTSFRYKPSEFFRSNYKSASGAVVVVLACQELPYGQSRSRLCCCIEYLHPYSALWASARFGPKGNGGHGGEEAPGSQIVCQSGNNLTE